MFKFKTLIISTLISFNSSASVDNAREMLVTSKFNGYCGAIYQMGSFQEVTKMKGGTEFLVRFIKTESARLGFTVDQFLDACKNASRSHKRWMSVNEK